MTSGSLVAHLLTQPPSKLPTVRSERIDAPALVFNQSSVFQIAQFSTHILHMPVYILREIRRDIISLRLEIEKNISLCPSYVHLINSNG